MSSARSMAAPPIASKIRLPYADDTLAETDPRDVLLDAAEELIGRAVGLGLGPQLEARLLRMFPELTRAPIATPDTSADAGAASRFGDIDRAISLAGLLGFLERRSAKTEPGRREIETHAAFVRVELASIRGAA